MAAEIKERVLGKREIDEVSGNEEKWHIDTPSGTIYGVDSQRPGCLCERSIWLPNSQVDGFSSLPERFASVMGPDLFIANGMLPTEGLGGEKQVLMRIRVVKPVISFIVEENLISSPEDRTSKESISRFNKRLSQAIKAGAVWAALQEDGYFPLNLRGKVDSLVGRIRALVQFIENPDAACDIREIAANETEKSQPFIPIA